MTKNVLMMAAGTGGHVFPALAVADELQKRGATIHWLGTPTGMENVNWWQSMAISFTPLICKGFAARAYCV